MGNGSYRFDADYREELVLDDGTRVLLRLLRPDDAHLLAEGFSNLSPESRRSRFFSAKQELTQKELDYFTHPDNHSHVAIAAVEMVDSTEKRGLGVARFVRFSDRPEVADVAVTVIDELQHHGLGTALCTRLIEAAKERGLERLHFEILATNRPMIALLHDLSSGVKERVEGGVVTAEIELAD
jgi:RimJ/RimL family protein N-acetyltransferase